ncbi:MAG: NAD(P)-dependent oxidoreductase [Bacteroidia bacterium]|nr:NAD(P)-dependent oxidoreductase [Bacteroidia bacterium]MDW8332981.1 NAD(P)-dependent oxidoreductase [Bacteroidia bacterium]
MTDSILITGANGLLGRKLTDLLAGRRSLRLIAPGRGKNKFSSNGYEYISLDVTRAEEVRRTMDQTRPSAVIHCAAMTNVDACELDPDACRAANVDAVRNLVEACENVGARLVHLSTDFVFDGADGPYDENAVPNPLSVYGKAKWMAEEYVKAARIPAAIVRTMLVYGVTPDMSRSNIVLWVKKSLEEGKSIRVVNDQYRMPTLAEDLAAGVCEVVFRGKTGIWHISGAEGMTMYELALRVARFWNLSEALISPCDSHSLNQPAPRPPRTGFILLKAQTELGYRPHSFEAGLEIVARQLKAYSQ